MDRIVVAVESAPVAHHDVAADAPGLTAVVAQVLDLEPDLLHHLAVYGLLKALGKLGEARDKRRALRAGTVGVLGQKQVVPVRHGHDDRRVDAREDHVAALGTAHHALIPIVDELFPAAAAVARVAVPRAQVPRADRRIGELLGLFRAEKADVAVGVAVERALIFVKKQVILPPVELKKIGERLVGLGKLRARRELETVVVDAAQKVLPAELHHGAALFRHGVFLPLVKKVFRLDILDHVGFPPACLFFRRTILQRIKGICKRGLFLDHAPALQLFNLFPLAPHGNHTGNTARQQSRHNQDSQHHIHR